MNTRIDFLAHAGFGTVTIEMRKQGDVTDLLFAEKTSFNRATFPRRRVNLRGVPFGQKTKR